MEYGSMVHALEEIHRLLKPDGELIDIHPVSEHSSIEIHQNRNIDLVGYLEVNQWCVDFQQADDALAGITKRGLFSVEQKGNFDTLTYYDSAEEMGTAFKESIHKYARDDQSTDEEVTKTEALTIQAEALMRTGDSEAKLALRERNHISRFKPM